MKIGGPQLARRVESWGKRLADLGVAHWHIEFVALCDDGDMPGQHNDANACVQCAPLYTNCRFYFNRDYLESAKPYDLDETIIHEWLHIAMRDFDRSLEVPEPWMPEATYQQWTERVNEEREGFIDGLAKALMTLHEQRKPRFKP